MNGRVDAEENRDLDRARRMQPAVGMSPEADAGLGVVNGDGDRADALRPLEGVEVSVQAIERGFTRRRRGRENRDASGHEIKRWISASTMPTL